MAAGRECTALVFSVEERGGFGLLWNAGAFQTDFAVLRHFIGILKM
jgi:hypothetical protein